MGISWNAACSMGNEEMDRQHQKLCSLIHDLSTYRELAAGDIRREYVQAVLNQLAHHACEHFEYEERVLESNHYPYLDEHKHSHSGYNSFIMEQTVSAIRGEIQLDRLIGFLEDWWVTHVLNEDTKCRGYMAPRHS